MIQIRIRIGLWRLKQKTAYEISECDWSSDVCSSDLPFRFQPDAHTVGITQLHYVTHTFDTFDLRNHVDVEVIGKERLVVALSLIHI